MEIREVRQKDASELLLFFEQVGGESDNLTFGKEGLQISEAEELQFIKGIIGSSNEWMIVAIKEGRIVGNAGLSKLPRRMKHRGRITICVRRDTWRQGIGSKLLEYLLAVAEENGLEQIELEVRKDNIAAIRLYESFGFKKIATIPDFFKIEDDYIDFDYMILKMGVE